MNESSAALRPAEMLAATPLFKRIPADQLSGIISRCTSRTMRAGDTLFRRGDPGTTMVLIITGQIRIVLPGPGGREQVLRVLQPGEVVGELSLLDGRGRSADAVAQTNGSLLVVERRDVIEAMRLNPDLALTILTILTERLRATSWMLAAMTFHDAGGRLAIILLTLAQQRAGHRVDITQAALGERVGATRETVNRKLREWQAAGILALEPGRITVLDPAALRSHAPLADMPEDVAMNVW
jgi:CRP/FNR family cyclic AMP-dependent transcriptional regulator